MSENTTIAYFNNEVFAEGRFRYAYKGTWSDNTSKQGQPCVIKKFKDSYSWEVSKWDTTVKMHDKAQELASEFGSNLEYVGIRVGRATVKDEKSRGIKNDEYVVAEDYLEGDFIKWCNNYGYVSTKAREVDNILTAFMHWTWVKTGGEEMVGDIQGIKTHKGEYKLTDPAIMSITNKYGPTDTGVEGMAMFFLTHKCTPRCQNLVRPTLAQFVKKIPDQFIQAAIQLQKLTGGGTTYTHEIKFPLDIKKILVIEFVRIATAGDKSHSIPSKSVQEVKPTIPAYTAPVTRSSGSGSIRTTVSSSAASASNSPNNTGLRFVVIFAVVIVGIAILIAFRSE